MAREKYSKIFTLSEREIEKIMENVKPNPLTKRHKYFVKIKDRFYPINQVVAKLCNLPILDVYTLEAYHVLKEKGFKIYTRDEVEEEIRR